MNRKEEYAIAVIILVALVMTVASMVTSDMNLGIGAVAISIVAVLYSIYVIHAEGRAQEGRQFAARETAGPYEAKVSESLAPRYDRKNAMKGFDKKESPDDYAGLAGEPVADEGVKDEEPQQVKKKPQKQQPVYDFDEQGEEIPRQRKGRSRNMLGTEDE